MLDQTISQFILVAVTAAGAVIAAMWLGIVLWTLRDMRSRSRDTLAQGAAALMVGILNIFGLIIYLMLRPRETLAEAYERSLEEEALLQGIEDKSICPGCGRPSHVQWQVCPYCYTRLKKQCSHCGQMIDLSWNVCPFCATQQPNSEPRGQSRSRRPAAAPVTIERPPARSAQRSAPRPAADYDVDSQPLEFVEDDEL